MDTSQVGTESIFYDVQDSSGNAADTQTRIVQIIDGSNNDDYADLCDGSPGVFEDTVPPILVLNGDAQVQVAECSEYTDLGASAIDNIDGLITANIQTSGDVPVPTQLPGLYTIVFSVSGRLQVPNAYQTRSRSI